MPVKIPPMPLTRFLLLSLSRDTQMLGHVGLGKAKKLDALVRTHLMCLSVHLSSLNWWISIHFFRRW